jgi:hypothetical protein
MIALRFLNDSPGCQRPAYGYRIGAAVVTASQEIPILAPYAVARQHSDLVELPDQRARHFADDDRRTLIHQGQGWLVNAWRNVSAWRTAEGYMLAVGGIGSFAVSADGSQIYELAAQQEASTQERDEVVLGPVLLLALALQEQWALHASAVVRADGAIAFLGESGAGKSTLARYLHSQNEHRLLRIADDILLTAPRSDGIDALPHYPQLKLPVEQWPSHELPGRIEIRAAYIVNSQVTNARTVSVTPLNAKQASLALMRHTVAARLFGPELLKKHVNFCAGVAKALPIRLLTYPLEYGMQAKVGDAILADASGLSQH